MSAESQVERQVRTLARKHGFRVWKVREGRHYAEYGPYSLVDLTTNGIVTAGLRLDQLRDLLSV